MYLDIILIPLCFIVTVFLCLYSLRSVIFLLVARKIIKSSRIQNAQSIGTSPVNTLNSYYAGTPELQIELSKNPKGEGSSTITAQEISG
jgi:hypothetical protein